MPHKFLMHHTFFLHATKRTYAYWEIKSVAQNGYVMTFSLLCAQMLVVLKASNTQQQPTELN